MAVCPCKVVLEDVTDVDGPYVAILLTDERSALVLETLHRAQP